MDLSNWKVSILVIIIIYKFIALKKREKKRYHIRILIIISLCLGIYFLVVPLRQMARRSTINDKQVPQCIINDSDSLLARIDFENPNLTFVHFSASTTFLVYW